jgi:hypothetical protein
MSSPNLPERIAIGLARIVAGPERRRWLEAMESELAHLQERRLDWALGSLVAAVKDRFARDWTFGLALGLLPGFAVVAGLVFTAVSVPLLKLAGLVPWPALFVPQVLAPLPFAYLLGRVRPRWPALRVGAIGFLAQQGLPYVAWRVLIGDGMFFFWGPTLWPLGVPVPLTLMTWLAGAWWGARMARHASRARPGPPTA